MIEQRVIIVGGGPAGSACAWELKKQGVSSLVLDKEEFPRTKLCAGWITPKVVRDLRLREDGYPHGMIKFERLHFRFYGRRLPVRTTQYSIRRYELDAWLLERSGAEVRQHTVRKIERDGSGFVIDGQFRCEILVGAGGTSCPVHRALFAEEHKRPAASRIVAQELEFAYPYSDPNCYLWFFDNNLPGYSWYVPKGNGYINIGIGGVQETLESRGDSIKKQWSLFLDQLRGLKLIDANDVVPHGHTYFLRGPVQRVSDRNVYLIGDAVGLATRDMGEGIGPAVESGMRAARSILSGERYTLSGVTTWSISELFRGMFSR